jgi:hypothetical protein
VRAAIRPPLGAASVVLSGAAGAGPLGPWGLLRGGDLLDCWVLDDGFRVLPLSPALLRAVRDDTALPDEQTVSPESVQEGYVLDEALLRVARAPASALERAVFVDLSSRNLSDDPWRVRGRVVLVDGKVRRVRRRKAPPELEGAGILHLYEVWMTTPVAGAPRLVCLLSPFAPPGLPVAEELSPAPQATLRGFLFKNYRYPKGGGVPGYNDPTVPLLVGRAVPLIDTRARTGAAAATVLLAARNPLVPPVLLQAGVEVDRWKLMDPLRAPPLEPLYLKGVRDNRPLPNGLEESDADRLETFAYYDAVRKVDETSEARFLRSVDRDITFAHLYKRTADYRATVVRIEGELRRVRRFKPMKMLQDAGVKDLYEVWLRNDEYGRGNLVTLICTKLPPGVEVAEQVPGRVKAAAVGYFFKVWSFKSADTKATQSRTAPLVIGYLVVPPKAAAKKSDWTSGIIPLFLGLLGGTTVIILGLTWMFRRADRNVQRRVDAAAAPPFGEEGP